MTLEHHYFTDFQAVTECVWAKNIKTYTRTKKGYRFRKELCSPRGFPGGLYDRGHLLASEFGAGMEAINLVSMPSPVNRWMKPDTAERKGLAAIAELGRRYINPFFTKGTLTGSDEWALPSYRAFEQVTKRLVHRGRRKGFNVSLEIKPSTVGDKTDIIYAKIFCGSAPVLRYKIDSDCD